MRFGSLALLGGLAIQASPAHAGVVLCFDGQRCYSGSYQYWLTGNGMVGPLAQLATAGHTVTTTALLTPAVLAGADVFVSGLQPTGSPWAQSEVDALSQWLAGGGSALLFGENSAFAATNAQFAAICGVVAGPSLSSNTVAVSAPAHPVITGPAGVVATLGQIPAPGSWTNVTATGTVVAVNPDQSAAIVAAQLGAGRAVLINDTAFFAYPPSYVSDNPILWDNVIAWLMGNSGAGAAFCRGDGTAAACPCANPGAAGEGCRNSIGAGSILRAIGQASVGADTLVLEGSQMPNAPALYFQGTQQFGGGTGIAFGDGLRCASGTLTWLAIQHNAGGASRYPELGEPPVSVRGNCAAGDVRTYQVWYRNAASFCTPSTFNLSNGYEVAWSI